MKSKTHGIPRRNHTTRFRSCVSRPCAYRYVKSLAGLELHHGIFEVKGGHSIDCSAASQRVIVPVGLLQSTSSHPQCEGYGELSPFLLAFARRQLSDFLSPSFLHSPHCGILELCRHQLESPFSLKGWSCCIAGASSTLNQQ